MRILSWCILCLLLCSKVTNLFGQDKYCSYETSSLDENAKGARIRILHSCEWHKESYVHPVAAVGFFGDDESGAAIGVTVNVVKTPRMITKKELDEIFSDKALKKSGLELASKHNGHYISSKVVTIDGLKASETMILVSYDLPMGRVWMGNLTYQCVVNKYIITLEYGAISKDVKVASTGLLNNLELFRELASLTIFVDQWN